MTPITCDTAGASCILFMKKFILLLAVAAFALSIVPSAEAGQGKHAKIVKHVKHQAKHHKHHNKHHAA
ncbi:MAG: hypothetical protein JF609_03715 [Verrucomicrobia bacterium]|nr:hypothetical protein [Verrucomicrobiota bacterium]